MKFRHFLIILLLGSFLFWLECVKDIPYYDDDYQFYFDPKPDSSFHYFLNKNPRNSYAWRPFEATFLLFVQKNWDLNPAPIHLAAIAGHLILAVLVFLTFKRLYDEKIGIIASLLFCIHPAAVHPVASIDTLSQIYGVLFTYISCFVLFFWNKTKTRDIVGLLFIGLALLSKETSVCVLPVLFLAYMLSGKFAAEKRILIAVFALIAVYMLVRAYLGFPSVKWGSGRFGLNLFQIPKNLAILWFAALNPFSTLDIFGALKSRNIIFLLIVGLVFFLFLIPLIALIQKQRSVKQIAGIYFALGCAFLVPIMFFNHVSELYVYSLLPFACGLVAIFFIKDFQFPVWLNLFRTCALCLFFVLSIHSVYTKTRAMLSTGNQAAKLMPMVIEKIKSVSPGGTLVLTNPECAVEYSVFSACGFNAINDSLDWIRYKAGRPDVKIEIVRADKL